MRGAEKRIWNKENSSENIMRNNLSALWNAPPYVFPRHPPCAPSSSASSAAAAAPPCRAWLCNEREHDDNDEDFEDEQNDDEDVDDDDDNVDGSVKDEGVGEYYMRLFPSHFQ